MKEEIWNELYLYLIRIEIGVFKNFKECAPSPCNGNHFSSYWASEASPTLGCSIQISRDIYMFMCLSWSKMRTHYVAKHAHAHGQFGAVKTTLIIHFDYTLEQL